MIPENLPYPVASVVEYEGKQYLIDEVSLIVDDHHRPAIGHVEYSIIGVTASGTGGEGSAWHHHLELKLVAESWQQMIAARLTDREAQYE